MPLIRKSFGLFVAGFASCFALILAGATIAYFAYVKPRMEQANESMVSQQPPFPAARKMYRRNVGVRESRPAQHDSDPCVAFVLIGLQVQQRGVQDRTDRVVQRTH